MCSLLAVQEREEREEREQGALERKKAHIGEDGADASVSFRIPQLPL